MCSTAAHGPSGRYSQGRAANGSAGKTSSASRAAIARNAGSSRRTASSVERRSLRGVAEARRDGQLQQLDSMACEPGAAGGRGDGEPSGVGREECGLEERGAVAVRPGEGGLTRGAGPGCLAEHLVLSGSFKVDEGHEGTVRGVPRLVVDELLADAPGSIEESRVGRQAILLAESGPPAEGVGQDNLEVGGEVGH